ncbi:MAG TPA: 2OG-Fe(II) oxygenase [Terriglobales bacterium]|nr:2OG-Fe(II) oxygenase [Terriglobales bacterium]
MTTRDLIDSLPDALLQDERILSARERELLASVVRHARNYEHGAQSTVAESIARAIGETVSQRAFALLGDRILQSIERQNPPSVELLSGVQLGTGPLPVPSPGSPQTPGPRPPSPSPPTSPNGISARRHMEMTSVEMLAGVQLGTGPVPAPSPVSPQTPGPRPPSPSPPTSPSGISARQKREPISPFGGPQPPSPYGLRSTTVAYGREGNVAVLEAAEILPAQCVIFDEFLVPAQLEALMAYTQAHERDFEVSEVLSPGVKGGAVDHEQRRSRVMAEPGAEIDPLLDRVKACLPRVLSKLGLESFAIAHTEAQITASNHGDFFRWHSDNAQEEIATREITFVYFFHREPRKFHGGELRIYDSLPVNGTYLPTTSYRAVVPRQNQIVFFRSSLAHEITPVECPTGAFGDSRFTVNGWFHR